MENSKFNELKQYLLSLNEQGICLAFSGGVDSALLLYLCKDLNLFAVTAESVFQTSDEIKFTKDFPLILEKQKEIVSALKKLGYRYITLDLEGLRRGSMDN